MCTSVSQPQPQLLAYQAPAGSAAQQRRRASGTWAAEVLSLHATHRRSPTADHRSCSCSLRLSADDDDLPHGPAGLRTADPRGGLSRSRCHRCELVPAHTHSSAHVLRRESTSCFKTPALWALLGGSRVYHIARTQRDRCCSSPWMMI